MCPVGHARRNHISRKGTSYVTRLIERGYWAYWQNVEYGEYVEYNTHWNIEYGECVEYLVLSTLWPPTGPCASIPPNKLALPAE